MHNKDVVSLAGIPEQRAEESDPAELAHEVVDIVGTHNNPRVVGMIAGAPAHTLGEKVEALAEADDIVEFTDLQLLQRNIILAASHRLMAKRRAQAMRTSIARRYT